MLVVDDDATFVRVLATALDVDGYRVLDAANGQAALAEIRTRNPDIVLLDLGLPDVDGVSLVAEIRRQTAVPIIVVSGRDHETNKVAALDAGATDYVTKPFSTSELRARIRVGLRSVSRVDGTAVTQVAFGDFTFDLERRRLSRAGRPVHLSLTEVKLLSTLARSPDRLVTTAALLKATWGAAYQNRVGYVRVYMHSLRGKLERDPARPRYLLTELGLGYKLHTGKG